MPRRNFVPENVIGKLVEMVWQNPALYDTSRKDHNCAMMTATIWDTIATTLNWEDKPGDFWKTRWRTLRDTYVRKKRENKSDSGGGDTSKWKYLDILQFLDDFIEQQSAVNNLNADLNSLTENQECGETEHGGEVSEFDTDSGCAVGGQSSSNRSRKGCKRTPPRANKHAFSASKLAKYRSSTDPECFEKALIDLCTSANRRRENIACPKDEDEVFLEPYALRLKKLPKDVKGVVQLQIAQLFFNAENRHLPPQSIMSLPPVETPVPSTADYVCVYPQDPS